MNAINGASFDIVDENIPGLSGLAVGFGFIQLLR
jgi:hypothetical protein